ncbi:MAG: SUMF1/EgtB/PvdO family nonheme iron enzyme [Methylococcales bacterium]|nr:SUMF1/EgtB/PvdO family nonheme iron enzyme [Methylococcales bacterium]
MALDENSNDSIIADGNPHQFRIFLASPGDVPLERKLAREAITHINSERRLRGRIDIEIIAWSQPGAAVAMEAGLTPQEAISQGLPKPEDCDLAVIILWSRIGTQLPADFELKEDGSPYLSGTEWEYLNALKGYRTKRKPSVWVYRKNGAPNPGFDDPNFATIVEQWDKVKKFFAAFTNPDGSLAGGINPYETPDDFRQQFEHHLRDRLDKLLETLPATNVSQTAVKNITVPRWAASPYSGLEAFTPEQAPIYFGRGREIDQMLQQFADPKVRFVAVVGVSGSGKSSLIKAGLLPRLRTGIIGNAPWNDLIFKPGERGDNLFLPLAFALKTKLDISVKTENEIARALQSDASSAKKYLTELLLKNQQSAELLLVIDQFEELFTQCSANYRDDFLALLEHLVTLPRIRAIVTLRADFYARAIQDPTLANLLRQERGTFPLDPPGLGAILEMIIRPAETAGVELQEGLAQQLLDDAGSGPGAMALIAFTLNQLYQSAKSSLYLSIDAYKTFGGVKHAIQTRAEDALKGLPIDLNIVLPKLFANLVGINDQGVVTRRHAPQSLLKGDINTIADTLIEARLLVTGKGEDHQPMLEFAHETVLSGWERLRLWIGYRTEALRALTQIEAEVHDWKKSGRHDRLRWKHERLDHTRDLLTKADLLSQMEEDADVADFLTPETELLLKELREPHTGHTRRAEIGHRLDNIGDSRPGIGLRNLIPDIEWVEFLGGQLELNNFRWGIDVGHGGIPGSDWVDFPGQLPGVNKFRRVIKVQPFKLSRYLVTWMQYKAFLDDPQGYDNAAWWSGIKKCSQMKDAHVYRGYNNYPVEGVTWPEAIAFCRWLTTRLRERNLLEENRIVQLPTEWEWQYAATEGDPKRIYPWGSEWDERRTNTAGSRLGHSISVGMYPHGETDSVPLDLVGNLWEWCQNKLNRPEWADLDATVDWRAVRGGGWDSDLVQTRTDIRNGDHPRLPDFPIGFRLCCVHDEVKLPVGA